jgi:hypothetical protein
MPIIIQGNEYVTVAERVQEIHKQNKKFDITTEVLSDDPVVIKATVVIEDVGTFTGISAANPSKAIEKNSPYEVAETSAVGRALGFAGFGLVDSIATADEMSKAGVTSVKRPTKKVDDSVSVVCEECGVAVSARVQDYSNTNFGKVLCIPHQAKEKANVKGKASK